MSKSQADKCKDLCNFLINIKNKEHGLQVMYFDYDTITVKQISFLGTFTQWKHDNFKGFTKYLFNCYTQEHGLLIKYMGMGRFKVTEEKG